MIIALTFVGRGEAAEVGAGGWLDVACCVIIDSRAQSSDTPQAITTRRYADINNEQTHYMVNRIYVIAFIPFSFHRLRNPLIPYLPFFVSPFTLLFSSSVPLNSSGPCSLIRLRN